MKIQLYSIQLKKLYLFIALLSPIWITVPVLIQQYGGHQYLVVFIGLVLLTITGILAQKIAQKQIEIAVDAKKIVFGEIQIVRKELQSLKINKSGIGVSAIEFYLDNDKKTVLHLPNLKQNADKGIAFIEKALPDVKIIEPVDLLEE